MRRLGGMILGLAIGAGLMFGAMKYHVLRTNSGFEFVPKRSTSLADAYVDVRGWGFTDWSKHPDLVWSLTKNGKTNVMGESGAFETTLKDALNYVK